MTSEKAQTTKPQTTSLWIVVDYNNLNCYGPFKTKATAEKWLRANGIDRKQAEWNIMIRPLHPARKRGKT